MWNSNMEEFFVFDHGKVEKIDRCGSSAFLLWKFRFFVVEVPLFWCGSSGVEVPLWKFRFFCCGSSVVEVPLWKFLEP